MDYLSSVGLEPQLAIPVVGVVLFAVLVYIFGFQKTEEPSYEHLAVLQSTYKPKSGSGLKPKTTGVSQASKTANASKAKEKPLSNGHIVQDKEKNGSVKNGKALNGLNKENRPPQNVKTTPGKKEKKVTGVKPADFEDGDWIQAVSRKDKNKDKKKVVKKDTVKLSPNKANRVSTPEVEEPWENKALTLKEVEAFQVQNQTTQTTPLPSPEKKAKSTKATTTTKESSSGSSAEPTPKKQPKALSVEKSAPAPAKEEEDEVVEVAVKENAKPETPKKSVEEPVVIDNPKNNVAFDEMAGTAADIWEEAKSRGTKKRRTRRD